MNWITDMFSGKDKEIKKQAELTNKDTEWERKVEANDWVKDVMSIDETNVQREADEMQHSEEEAGGIDDIMRWEEGDLDESKEVAMFQKMINDGSVWHMPGSTGRRAMELLRAGLCELGEERFKDAYGNTVPSKHDVQPGTTGAPLETRNREAAVEDRFIYKTAAYEKGDSCEDTIKKDYDLRVKGLSDYNLAEMLAEYVCLENNTATLNLNEEKESQLKSVKSGRDAAEKKLLKYLGDHTLIDWKKSFKGMEESEVKHPEEKDLYSEWKAGKMAWEKKSDLEAPSDKEKLKQMEGVGKEEEKGQVGKEASKKSHTKECTEANDKSSKELCICEKDKSASLKTAEQLKCPECGSENVTPGFGHKLHKCDSCHTAFDTASDVEAAPEDPAIVENPVPAEPAPEGGDAPVPVTDVVPEATPDMTAPMADAKPGIDDKITTKIDEKIEEKAEEIAVKIEEKIEEHAEEMASKVEQKIEEKIEEAFNTGPMVKEDSPEDKVLDELQIPHLEPGETPESEMKEWKEDKPEDKKEDKPKEEKSEDKKEDKKEEKSEKKDDKEKDKKEDKKDEEKDDKKEDKESSLKTEAGFNGWKNYETWNIALWFDYDETLRNEKVGFLKTGAKSGSDIAAFVMELLPTGTPDFDGKSSRYLKANWDELAEVWKSEAGEPTILPQVSKEDVIKKVAEIASPWRVVKNERGEEVIARVTPTKTEKKSKEKDLKNGINSQDLK